jgi:DNA-binding transcriptional MerR regulator
MEAKGWGSMKGHTVRQLARLAGVSVRTLHHYDRIGILKPESRSEAGYRLYGKEDLLRLQQILFFRELDFPLPDIARILEEPGFNPVQALRDHRAMLEARLGRLHGIIRTLDRTIEQYQGGSMLTDEELYRGFPPEKIARMKKEARDRYGTGVVEESENKVRRLSKEAFAAVMRDGEEVNRALAGLIGREPTDPDVRKWVARHHAWILNFWTPTEESYRGLGKGYSEHPEFRAFYEKYAPGLADFLNRAIDSYCDDFPG